MCLVESGIHVGQRVKLCHHCSEYMQVIIAGTRQHRILERIIKSPYLLRNFGKLSPDVQTSYLELYHAVICHFASKLNHFTVPMMQAK